MDDYQPMEQPAAVQPVAQPAPAQKQAAPTTEAAPFDFSKADPAKISQVFQDPRFLAQAAHNYLSRGLPEGLKYLEHANTAAKENVIEAISRLEQGDGDGAIKAFNVSGRFTGANSAKDNGDGTWTLGDKDGRSTTINPVNLKKTLVSPEAYFRATEAEKRTGILQQEANSKEKDRIDRRDAMREQNTNQDQYWRRLTDNKERENELRGEATVARYQGAAASAQARADLDAHKAELNDKYGPMAVYTKLLEKEGPDAEKNADRALARHISVVPYLAADGRVGIFHERQFNEQGKPTGRPYRTFESAAEYEKATDLKMPKRAAPEAAGPPAPPRSVAPKAEPEPLPDQATMTRSIRDYEASSGDRAKTADAAKQSPRYAELQAQRRAAIKADDSKRITAIDKEMKALLNGDK